MQVLYWIIMPVFLFLSFIMILLVLIQKGRGGGLSGAFGGSGGNTAFGAKTGDVLTWATSIVFALFVTLAAALGLICDNLPGNKPPAAPQTQQVPATPSSPTQSAPTPGK